jgi:hypothetical protein
MSSETSSGIVAPMITDDLPLLDGNNIKDVGRKFERAFVTMPNKVMFGDAKTRNVVIVDFAI